MNQKIILVLAVSFLGMSNLFADASPQSFCSLVDGSTISFSRGVRLNGRGSDQAIAANSAQDGSCRFVHNDRRLRLSANQPLILREMQCVGPTVWMQLEVSRGVHVQVSCSPAHNPPADRAWTPTLTQMRGMLGGARINGIVLPPHSGSAPGHEKSADSDDDGEASGTKHAQ